MLDVHLDEIEYRISYFIRRPAGTWVFGQYARFSAERPGAAAEQGRRRWHDQLTEFSRDRSDPLATLSVRPCCDPTRSDNPKAQSSRTNSALARCKTLGAPSM